MRDQVALTIIATEAKAKLDGITGLEERLLVAMRTSKNHWITLDEEVQMSGAIAAVLMVLKEEGNDKDHGRITKELNTLRAISASQTGVPVDFSAIDMPENPIGLVRLWQTVQKEGG